MKKLKLELQEIIVVGVQLFTLIKMYLREIIRMVLEKVKGHIPTLKHLRTSLLRPTNMKETF